MIPRNRTSQLVTHAKLQRSVCGLQLELGRDLLRVGAPAVDQSRVEEDPARVMFSRVDGDCVRGEAGGGGDIVEAVSQRVDESSSHSLGRHTT